MKLTKQKNMDQIALLAAFAAVLQISESLIPHPIPGIRLGLANIITLIALNRMGFRSALKIAFLRSLISSLIIGTFLSPGFFLSISGAMGSTLVMGAAFRFLRFRNAPIFSLIGISLFGSITHNLIQIALVYFVFIPHTGLFWMLPWLGISAIVMGWITGLVAIRVCDILDNSKSKHSETVPTLNLTDKSVVQIPVSPISRLRPEIKVIGVFIVSLLILLFSNISIFIVATCLITLVMLIARISWFRLFRKVKRLSPIFLFSFLLPVFLTQAGPAWIQLGWFKITQSGLDQGLLFTARLILLLTATSILTWTTSQSRLTHAISWLLKPLRVIGLDNQHYAEVLTLALNRVPHLLEIVQGNIRNHFKNKKRIHEIIPDLSDLISSLYIQTEQLKPMKMEELYHDSV
ncbi:Gx transporter family protein [candidate division KSB1 bacterium]|nr:Gx transporter family protein [candidate division KSB1 bacterium]